MVVIVLTHATFHALGIRLIRTYQTELEHPRTVLKAIRELKDEDPNFEMYLMVGAWINCDQAWTGTPNHEGEDAVSNAAEIARAVKMAQDYPDIVKILAVGNEAMVRWAASYFVQPKVILKWVNHLQDLKAKGELAADLWITSSDNFASWGGGDPSYHNADLEALIRSVDYVYPMHDTHYNPDFWGVTAAENDKSKVDQINTAMTRALNYAQNQFKSTKAYVHSVAPGKPIHIGETGWASSCNNFYGPKGSKAVDEYKQGIYYKLMRDWTHKENISCFYFEGFDEPWKDAANPGGSENHFGLFTVDGKAKFGIWEDVDEAGFKDLRRGGNQITKTHKGNLDNLLSVIEIPPLKEIQITKLK